MTENESNCDGCTVCFQFLQLAGEVSFAPEYVVRGKNNSFSNTSKELTLKTARKN